VEKRHQNYLRKRSLPRQKAPSWRSFPLARRYRPFGKLRMERRCQNAPLQNGAAGTAFTPSMANLFPQILDFSTGGLFWIARRIIGPRQLPQSASTRTAGNIENGQRRVQISWQELHRRDLKLVARNGTIRAPRKLPRDEGGKYA
jgi:hypothetical protein